MNDRTKRAPKDLQSVIEQAVERALEFARPEYLDRKQMAAELGVQIETLRDMERRGLPVHCLGPRTFRFVRSEVDTWIRSQEGAA